MQKLATIVSGRYNEQNWKHERSKCCKTIKSLIIAAKISIKKVFKEFVCETNFFFFSNSEFKNRRKLKTKNKIS